MSTSAAGVGTKIVLYLLASPLFLLAALDRAIHRVRFYRMAYRPGIACRTCGQHISLVGLWQCGCGYTYEGHLLRPCPICASLPRMARCYNCGATELLPKP
jgi:hypothetical protein